MHTEEPRSFFVSYAREDEKYVTDLVNLLQREGLPTWYDIHMRWGGRIPDEIRQRIVRALAIIVVMSPASYTSEWVEREILEGQHSDRDFLPILLAGERLFLLASSNFFDARSGVLPGRREIHQLKLIRDADRTHPATIPSLVLPPPAPARLTSAKPTPDRKTSTGSAGSAPGWAPTGPIGRSPADTIHPPATDTLHRLTTLVEDGQLAHADILTTSLVLQAARRLDSGWLRRGDGANLSFATLTNIDSIWSRAKPGRHGFTAQLSMHAQSPDDAPAGRQRDFVMLATAVGWRSVQRDIAPPYGELVGAADFPDGFFPTLRNPQLERHTGWHDRWMETVMAIHLRLRTWAR